MLGKNMLQGCRPLLVRPDPLRASAGRDWRRGRRPRVKGRRLQVKGVGKRSGWEGLGGGKGQGCRLSALGLARSSLSPNGRAATIFAPCLLPARPLFLRLERSFRLPRLREGPARS